MVIFNDNTQVVHILKFMRKKFLLKVRKKLQHIFKVTGTKFYLCKNKLKSRLEAYKIDIWKKLLINCYIFCTIPKTGVSYN